MSIAGAVRKIHKNHGAAKVVIVCEPGEMDWEKRVRKPGKIEVQLRLDSNRGIYSDKASLRSSDEKIEAMINKLYLLALKGLLDSSKSDMEGLVKKAIEAKNSVKEADHKVVEKQREIDKTLALISNTEE